MGVSTRNRSSRSRIGLEITALVSFIIIGIVLISPGTFLPPSTGDLKEAKYYTKLDENTVQCQLCFRRCNIAEGLRGFCTNRKNIGGTLYSLVYGKPSAIQIDPVEKEPLFHVNPGSRILGIGTAGCNFRCSFCQNWPLSTRRLEEVETINMTIGEAVRTAKDYAVSGIHFTYNEPTVFYEYMYDVAIQAKVSGLTTAFHSNGAMNPEPLRALLQYIDAVTIDLKGFSDEFYEYVTEQAVSGSFLPSTPPLEQVLTTLKIIKEKRVWLEIVNLVIPTLNDDMDEIREMCVWIKENLGEDVPLHFNRFFPAHKLTKLPVTPIETLEKARDIALDIGLKYVYIGNVPGHEANSTFCPRCGQELIERRHFIVISNNIVRGRCSLCSHEIPGIWELDEHL